MLSRLLRDQIDASDAFLCILPEGRFAGTEGELQLRYAVRRRKHIILFRAEDRGHLPIPAALDGVRVNQNPIETSPAWIGFWEGDRP